MKHTLAPWVITRTNTRIFIHAGPLCDDYHAVAETPVRVDEQDPIQRRGEDLANARLMAAAPDLLEALREVVVLSDRKHPAWDRAKLAIAKAVLENDLAHE